ncbi:MAG TPA: hypothetical protein VMU62_09640, partial [Acidobacteriaceae bacterium]|nr:hypothetical protein [Acidobacteriaceae bacterium]
MPLQQFLAHYLNLLLGGPVTHLLTAIGLAPANPAAPMNGTFTMELLAVVILLAFFLIVRLTINVERPGTAQQLAEMVQEF